MIMRMPYIQKFSVYGVILLLSVLMFVPFLIMLSYSLKSMAEIQSPSFHLIPQSFRWSNYPEAMTTGNWGRYFLNSFVVTATTVAVGVAIMSLAGFSFARLRFRGRDMLFLFSLVGLMIPEQVIMISVFIKIKTIPLFGGNNIWGEGGTGWLNSYLGLIVPNLAAPLGVFLFRQFFLGFPKEIDEAAKIDGFSTLKTFVRIYVPLCLPVFATLILLKSVSIWNQYTWPLIIVNEDRMKTVQLALSLFKAEFGVEWNYVMAATTLIALPVILLFLFLQKYYVQGIVTTGIK